MRRASVMVLSVILLLSLTTLWGCPKKAEVSSAPEEPKVDTAADDARRAEEEARKAEEARRAAEAEEAAARERSAKDAGGVQSIFFDFDRSFVRDDAKAVMKANAEWLKANPNAKVKIEGNCDERGTIEYNQALGQRRAAAAKKYLTDLGISAKRISLISYGKEKPSCTDANEDCWQKNRRDDFVVSE